MRSQNRVDEIWVFYYISNMLLTPIFFASEGGRLGNEQRLKGSFGSFGGEGLKKKRRKD